MRLLCSPFAGFWEAFLGGASSSRGGTAPQGAMRRLLELQLPMTAMLSASRSRIAGGVRQGRSCASLQAALRWLGSGCPCDFHLSPQVSWGELPPLPLAALRRCCLGQESMGICFSLSSSISSDPEEEDSSRQQKERVWATHINEEEKPIRYLK